MTISRARQIVYALAVPLGALTTMIWYAVSRGQDFNWDQQNYHIGVPFLLSHGTFWDSIAPAGIQTYLNPYVLQAEFAVMQHVSAIHFAVACALVQSLAFMAAGVICADIARPSAGWKLLTMSLLGFGLCLMAPIALSEAGGTFIDLITAVPVLAAYAVLMARGRFLGLTKSGVLAGALLGAAAALKLNNALFCIGMAGFAVTGPESWRPRLQWAFAAGCATILSFAVIGSGWYFTMYQRFKNPFFPFLNNIFHSPDFAMFNLRDERFLPHSLLDIWYYPLHLMLADSPTPSHTPTSELPFVDARWIVAIVGGTLDLGGLILFPKWGKRRLMDPATGLLLAFAIDYLVWLGEFSIQRYAVTLEILCGAVILLLTMQLPPFRLKLLILSAITALSWHMLVVPDWVHLPWKPYWQAINPKRLDFGGPSIVFLTGKPSFFIAASLPLDARYVGIQGDFDLRATSNTAMTRQLVQELSAAPSNVRLKSVDDGSMPAVSVDIMASHGLFVTDQCEMLQVATRRFHLCDVERRSPLKMGRFYATGE